MFLGDYSILVEPLIETIFWDLIHAAREKVAGADEKLCDSLVPKVATLPLKMIFAYHARMIDLMRMSYRPDLWCTARVAIGTCSDDGFDYFRAWLIGRGKQAFYGALENPDSLCPIFEELRRKYALPDNEMLLSVANLAYELKTKRCDYLDTPEYKSIGSMVLAEIEFNWSSTDEESMRKICPNVFSRFWKNHIMEVFNTDET